MYSRSHSPHILNAAIVVFARSYGTRSVIEYRGPQFVQFVNAYPKRRSEGDRTSSRHCAHVATSGDVSVKLPASGRLSTIVNDVYPASASSAAIVQPSIREIGGASDWTAAAKRAASSVVAVSISMKTPSELL